VGAVDEFAGHTKSPQLIIFIAARSTETRFATKSREFKFSAIRAGEHGSTIRRVATVNHFADVFHNGLARMEFVFDMFIIIGKNSL
jgi:hypothetical protein